MLISEPKLAAAVSNAKQSLRQVISTTNRGGTASSSQRGAVEEAQVDSKLVSCPVCQLNGKTQPAVAGKLFCLLA